MQIIQGKPISPGYAQGRAVLFGAGELSAPRRTVTADEVEGEIERFHTALEDSQRDLLQLQERAYSRSWVPPRQISSRVAEVSAS